jgi:hypothetical protein
MNDEGQYRVSWVLRVTSHSRIDAEEAWRHLRWVVNGPILKRTVLRLTSAIPPILLHISNSGVSASMNYCQAPLCPMSQTKIEEQ